MKKDKHFLDILNCDFLGNRNLWHYNFGKQKIENFNKRITHGTKSKQISDVCCLAFFFNLSLGTASNP